MDIEKLAEIIQRGDWGNTIATGKHFYRSLFKKETLTAMSKEDVLEIFASYKKWRADIFAMIEECKRNNTIEDRNAASYGTTTNDDILEHIHRIVTEVPLVEGTKLEDIINEATKMET